MKFAVFLVVLCATFCGGNAGCSRGFNPTEIPDDCTTVTGHVNDTEEIECFEYVNGSTFQLEYPQENTRTCYRTCHDMSVPSQCEASLVNNVHNKPINVDIFANYTLQFLFSPNYNDVEDKDYRKSTICRYDVTCPAGKILAYKFVGHLLENRTNSCVVANKCVDYVTVSFPNTTDEEKTCGSEAATDTLFADGYSAVNVEFYANREEENNGFAMDVLCYEPGVTPARRRRRRRQAVREGEPVRQRPVTEEQLVRERPTECVRVSSTTETPTVDSAQQLLEALSSSRNAQEDLRNLDRCQLYIINELERVYYQSRKVVIRSKHTDCDEVFEEAVASDITRLYVSSRFNKSRSFQNSANRPFPGYGELYICGENAYMSQLGINPQVRPSREEQDLIAQLLRAVTKSVECREFFDVYDELDAEEEGVEFKPSICARNVRRECHLDDLARRYRNACNTFLRSAACSYLSIILKEDCK